MKAVGEQTAMVYRGHDGRIWQGWSVVQEKLTLLGQHSNGIVEKTTSVRNNQKMDGGENSLGAAKARFERHHCTKSVDGRRNDGNTIKCR